MTFWGYSSGTYYVAAGAVGDGEGSYTLSVVDVTTGDPDDFAAGTGTTGEVRVGGSARGEIEAAGDRDWFKVTLAAGTTYRIDLEGESSESGTLRDPYLRGIHDSNGVLIDGTPTNNGGDGYNSRVYFTPEEAGTYYVAAGASATHEGTYTLSVAEFVEAVDDFAADNSTTGSVAVGGTARGEIEAAGDRDWFEVTLEADRVYRIDLEGLHTRAGTLFDPYLYGVYDSNGVRLAGTTDDHGGVGSNSRVRFTTEEAGTYYVAAGADGTYEGTYKLSVREVANITADFAAGTETSGAVAVGGSVSSRIELRGDRDWFALELDAGKVYRIDLEGRATYAGTLTDPYLYGIHDANGALIADTTDDDGGTGLNSRVEFTLEESGTYYVAAGPWGGGTGSYTLSVADVTETVDDFAAGTGTSGVVEVGGSVTGEIDFRGDRDWFAVMLEADKTYRIDLEGGDTGDGTLDDPYLRGIHDANGDLIAGTTNDDFGNYNSRVTFMAVDAGTYYVAAGATLDISAGTNLGTYTLSVEEVL